MLGEVEEPFVVDLVVDLLLIIVSISTAPIATLQPTKMKAKNKDTVYCVSTLFVVFALFSLYVGKLFVPPIKSLRNI